MTANFVYDAIRLLTEPTVPPAELDPALQTFASELDWRPTDRLDIPSLAHVANAHLIVEHGLQHTAVISFARQRFADLDHPSKRELLTVSYNNLIDWHVYVSLSEVVYVYNRSDPWHVAASETIQRDRLDALRRQSFERISADRPNPSVLALDDALIRTVSEWRRNLSAALDHEISYEALSALFNALILVRATEDHLSNLRPQKSTVQGNGGTSTFLDELQNSAPGHGLGAALSRRLDRIAGKPVPAYLVDRQRIAEFDRLDPRVARAFVADFYSNRFAPYRYDFSLISKHALSRIYEHYVSLLRVEETPQHNLFAAVPTEEKDKAFGSVFTPQFIARFFSRYLRRHRPPEIYPELRIIDPACGSGIFLRTFLELHLDPTRSLPDAANIERSFDHAEGIDLDANACAAARLSLALLHLVLTDGFPARVRISQADALSVLYAKPASLATFDAVLANPPFVSLDTQTAAIRESIAAFFGEEAVGRTDLYLAFLRLGLELLRPGGLGLFVLPRSFLIGKSAGPMRRLLLERTCIRAIADLSAIPVFEGVGSYVVLLIFEKASDPVALPKSPVTVLECRAQVGLALQDVVEGRTTSNRAYSIYEVSQETFGDAEWVLLPPAEGGLKARLSRLKPLAEYLHVKQGFISGNDQVFVIPRERVPSGETTLWAPLLRDRDMQAFSVPKRTNWFAFYPYVEGNKIAEQELRSRYKKTWAYLEKHRHELQARKSLRRYRKEWWEPIWPRSPDTFFRPKLVSPHLVLVPRFAVDAYGTYVVSHAPVLFPRGDGADTDLLYFFAAVLNSSVAYWHLRAHAHRYQRGYLMLENAVLRDLPVPDPATVSGIHMREILALVHERLQGNEANAVSIAHKLDALVALLYGISHLERTVIGIP